MGMADIKAAFISGLNGKASCIGATLTWEHVEDGQRKGQRLNFAVRKPDGSDALVSHLVPAGTNLVNVAREFGSNFAVSLGE